MTLTHKQEEDLDVLLTLKVREFRKENIKTIDKHQIKDYLFSIKWKAKKYNHKAFEKLQTIRFLDDWAYQANIRQNLKTTQDITTLMPPLIKQIENFLGYSAASYSFSYPWNRLFEIEVSINMDVNNEFNRSHSFSNSSIN